MKNQKFSVEEIMKLSTEENGWFVVHIENDQQYYKLSEKFPQILERNEPSYTSTSYKYYIVSLYNCGASAEKYEECRMYKNIEFSDIVFESDVCAPAWTIDDITTNMRKTKKEVIVYITSLEDYNKLFAYFPMMSNYENPAYFLVSKGNTGISEIPQAYHDERKYIILEFKDIVFPEDESSLPEKWCIKITKDNLELVGGYYNSHVGRSVYTDSLWIGQYFRSHNYSNQSIMTKLNPNAGFSFKALNLEYPEITLDQFKKHVLKLNVKESAIKKIIGYKSPIDLFQGQIPKGSIFSVKHSDEFSCYSKNYPLMGVPAEIVETWEPVYENQFKVGDWVTITLTEKEIEESRWWFRHTNVRTFQIVGEKTQFSGSEFLFQSNGPKHKEATSGYGLSEFHIRIATKPEIELAKLLTKEIELTLGSNSTKVTIDSTGIFARGQNFDIVKLKEILSSYTVWDYTNSGHVSKDYGISTDRSIRFIRISCRSENNLFSLKEIEQAVNAFESFKK